MDYVMGIDTSNYTTSLALMDLHTNLVFDERIMIEVPLGERGIRQSKALFQHQKNLPLLMERIPEDFKGIKAICVCTKPRPVEDSYLPVFLAGEEVARCVAVLMHLKLFKTTHQEGHIMALLWAKKLDLETFLVCHLSGGTTEVHLVKKDGPFLELQLLGESLDVYAGQYIDRIGVEMGLSFPAGPMLEELGKGQGRGYPLPVAVKGLDMSFSGPTSAAFRALKEGVNKALLARGVEDSIKNAIQKVLLGASDITGIKDVLLMGGVFSNQYITSSLKENLFSKGIRAFSTKPKYSRDSAVGPAYLGVMLLRDSL